jgi:hypothetical protein
VVARHAVVVSDDLPVLLGAEELLLQEDALQPAVVTDPRDVPEDRPPLSGSDLLEPAPHVDALHVGERRGIKGRGDIPLARGRGRRTPGSSPSAGIASPAGMFPRPRRGIPRVCDHRGSSLTRWPFTVHSGK